MSTCELSRGIGWSCVGEASINLDSVTILDKRRADAAGHPNRFLGPMLFEPYADDLAARLTVPPTAAVR
jgi:hypothetical protein